MNETRLWMPRSLQFCGLPLSPVCNIYATSLWKVRLWSSCFLRVCLKNYQFKVIKVRRLQAALGNSLGHNQHGHTRYANTTRPCSPPWLPKETSGFHAQGLGVGLSYWGVQGLLSLIASWPMSGWNSLGRCLSGRTTDFNTQEAGSAYC